VSVIAESSLITEEMRRLLGFKWQSPAIGIEKGMVRWFIEAVGDPNPLWWDDEYGKYMEYKGAIVPPTFLGSITLWGITERFAEMECPLGRSLSAGNEFEWFSPVSPGQRVTPVNRLAQVYKREGKTGKLLFLVIETKYKNEMGEVVARSSETMVRY